MLKLTKRLKKILAIMLLSITMITTIQPVVFGANQTISGSGNDRFMARQYATRIRTTDEANNGTNGIVARRLIMRNQGWNFGNGDGILVFCAQNGVHFATGENYEGNYYVPTTAELKQAARIAFIGWYQSRGQYGSDGNFADSSSLKQYAFTQQMVWEVLKQSSATFVDSNIQNEYISFKNDVNARLNRIQARPSFDGSNITLKLGETVTITDTNNVLAEYMNLDRTESGIHITHKKGENTMSFTVSEDCKVESYKITDAMFKNWGMVKEETKNNDTTVYLEFADGVQDQLYSLNYNDPVALRIDLSIEAKGKLELTKRDTNGELIEGAVFTVSGADGYNQEVTVTNGEIIIEDLKPRNILSKGKDSTLWLLIRCKNISSRSKIK